ncbi:ABC transporter permease [Bacillus sp. CGMCC 1.16607]|uniref:ABC transporter permease n=1 Tax=Bacillus sp. CGMCC 1.16607 TaxID=3351842 RepID=UPI0036306BCF
MIDVPEYKKKHALKLSLDYTKANFALVTSLALTLVLLLISIDFEKQSIKPYVFSVFVLHALFTTIQIFLTQMIKHDLHKLGYVRQATRRWGYIQLFSILIGNIFITIFSFHLIKRKMTTEYTFAVYMVITQIFVISLSALNLFKPYVADTFLLAMFILIAILIFQISVLVLVAKKMKGEHVSSWMIYIAIPVILTSITGNLFALLLGWNLLIKVRSDDKSRIGKWNATWEKITRNATSMLGLFFIVFVFSISICSSLTFDYSMAVDNNYGAILQVPSLAYPLGTDNFGRDLFSRIVFGARISLVVGILSTVIPFVIGGILGALSGYYGKRTDNIIMRLLDVLYAIPGILLAIVIIAAFGSNTVTLIIALSVGSIPTYARTMRANVLMVSNYEYVDSAKALGSSSLSIIFKHVVPNSLAPMIVKSTLTIGGAVIATSSLSYLGLGVEPHIPEWGNILKIGSTYLESHSYLAIYPGLAIIALVLSFNFLGDGLRDALDPKAD